jgi:sialate O-acetylesterase
MKGTYMLKRLTAVAALLLAAWSAQAQPVLPPIFGSNMALQRSEKTVVFGTAAPNAAVVVSFKVGSNIESVDVDADAAGRFRAALDLSRVGPTPGELTVGSDGKSVTFTNVIVGEVWLCGGQSNMQWTVRDSANAPAEIKDGSHPRIRLFKVENRIAAEPTSELKGTWVECSPETVGSFSAVGYFFGREISQKLNTPVGLISSNWGGTPAEAWTSMETLKSSELFAAILKRREEAIARDKVVLATQPTTRPAFGQNSAATLYNGMIRPLFPLTIGGTIWYQGESNAGRAAQYVPLLTAMIEDWRKGFESPDMPFLIVQLANYRAVPDKPGDDNWAELREAQAQVARGIRNGGLAVAIDIGEAGDIHPKNKQDVGKRLALQALDRIYKVPDLVSSGPEYSTVVIEGAVARIKFNHAAGLTVRGDKLLGFAICGEDRKWVWADAKIEGDTVLVSAALVPNPVAVRYGWSVNTRANLFNAAGLPAIPFRTDTFPLATRDAR